MDATRVKTIDPEYSLSVVLEDYKQASDYYARFKRHRYFSANKDCYLALVEYFYGDNKDIADKQLAVDIAIMEKDSVDSSRSVVPMLIMLCLGVIPSYWYKKTADADIEAEYERMVDFIEEMVARSEIFDDQPIISRFKRFAVDKVDKTRFFLIRWFEVILLSLSRTSSPFRLSKEFKNLQFVDFDIEGLWKTKEGDEVWRFERITDQSFYAYKYRVTSSPLWLYERFEMMLMAEANKIIACLLSSDAIDDMVKRHSVHPKHQSFVRFRCDDQNPPQQIVLSDIGADELDVARTLVRLGKKEALQMMEEHLAKAISLNPEKDYQVFSTAVAMTTDYLFFPVPKEEGLYYRVPRIEELQDIPLESFIEVTTKDRVIVGTGVNLIYYEVTTEAQRKKHGIDIITLP